MDVIDLCDSQVNVNVSDSDDDVVIEFLQHDPAPVVHVKSQKTRVPEQVDLEDDDKEEDYNEVCVIAEPGKAETKAPKPAPIPERRVAAPPPSSSSSLSAAATRRAPAVEALELEDDSQVHFLSEAPSSSSSSSSASGKRRRPEGARAQAQAPVQAWREIEVQALPLSPIDEILRVFPKAKREYVETLLLQNGEEVAICVSLMAENGYEKMEFQQEKPGEKAAEPEVNFDDFSAPVTLLYQKNCLNQLSKDFPFLYMAGIKAFAKRYNFHYKPAVLELEKQLQRPATEYGTANYGDDEKKYILLGGSSSSSSSSSSNFKPLTQADKVAMAPALLQYGLKVKQSLSYNNSGILDPRFSQEIAHMVQLRRKKWLEKEKERQQEVAYKIAEAEGSLVECGCCYGEDTFENTVACTEGHLFCCKCLNHFAEERVFGEGKSKLNCIATTESCAGWFVDAMLQKSLAPKTYNKLQEAIANDAIKAANLDNMVTCYECSYQCELPEGNIMVCPSCRSETCKFCGDREHIPLRCEEVEKKSAQDVRTRVEEAMTKARVRECNACKTRFYKIEGCNKMSCTCGKKYCYICREDITKAGYAHFCQKAHCTHKSCNKCVLFTNGIEDDKQAMAEAGLQTLQAAAAAGEGDGTGTLKVGDKDLSGPAAVEALLEGGRMAKKQKTNAGPYPENGNPGGRGARALRRPPPPGPARRGPRPPPPVQYARPGFDPRMFHR